MTAARTTPRRRASDMQKNCASCAHVGVCSKRMQFIVNNYLAKGHYEEIENISKTLDISKYQNLSDRWIL